MNMMKKDALYNYGMKPAVLSSYDRDNSGKDWHHAGSDVCYFKNGLNSYTIDSLGDLEGEDGAPRKKKVKQFYTLSFTYTFTRPDTVYFAHCYPYTYSDLQHFLHELEHDERIAKIMHRRLLCHTIAGNRCDILTITSRSNDKEEAMKRPAIVISARVHPGETNSSFAMHGLLRYLLSDQPEAISLRNSFVFKVVPMMNPDGVIHGNYRCSLAATDLNRRYANCNVYLHPTVSGMYRMLWNLQDSRGVLLYLDLHGHSKNKNVFVYGCDVVQQPEAWVKRDLADKSRMDVIGQRVFCRTFPRILEVISSSKEEGYFSFSDCKFNVGKGKRGTGRIVAWRDIGIEASYTIELSFCGVGDNSEAKLFRKADEKGFDIILDKRNGKKKKSTCIGRAGGQAVVAGGVFSAGGTIRKHLRRASASEIWCTVL